jgi:ubiquinone/menaquinone biosynthesis C-methylase UbiE
MLKLFNLNSVGSKFASALLVCLLLVPSSLVYAQATQTGPAPKKSVLGLAKDAPAQDKPATDKANAGDKENASEVFEETLPPAQDTYLGRRIAQTMSFHGANWLIRSEREQEERPSQVLPQLGLKPGMTVCDLGCGNGFYALEMAKMVAPGKVLAVDIQQEMLHLLKLRADEAKVDNIRLLQGTVIDPHLPPASVDLVLMVDVYHEFSHPEQMLSAIRKSLKPGGVIALLEYREEDPRVPIKPEHKMSKRQILKEYSANGLRLAKEYDELPWQHLMFFESDPDFKP